MQAHFDSKQVDLTDLEVHFMRPEYKYSRQMEINIARARETQPPMMHLTSNVPYNSFSDD